MNKNHSNLFNNLIPILWEPGHMGAFFGRFLFDSYKKFDCIIDTTGNLAIIKSNDNLITWSTDTKGGMGAKLRLLDNGDLQLKDSSGMILWHSNSIQSGTFSPYAITLSNTGELTIVTTNGIAIWSSIYGILDVCSEYKNDDKFDMLTEENRNKSLALGRILGYGSIGVIGTGGTKEYFISIKNPLEFRRKFQELSN